MARLLDWFRSHGILQPIRSLRDFLRIGSPEYWQYRNRLRTDIALRYNPKRDKDGNRTLKRSIKPR